jgi:hypothetical protein
MKFIATVKLPKNPEHDPRNKKSGTCPAMLGYCTDITGEHHSFVIDAKSANDAGILLKDMGFNHVTRIESL